MLRSCLTLIVLAVINVPARAADHPDFALLDDAAIASATRWRLQPATSAGRTVEALTRPRSISASPTSRSGSSPQQCVRASFAVRVAGSERVEGA
jgi:hypothetical protein